MTSPLTRDQYIWLSTFADVHEVLMMRNAFVMASYDAAKRLVFDNVLITLDGPDHLRRRRLESPLVRPAAVARLEAEITPEVARREIQAAQTDGDLDLVSISSRVATAIVAHLVGLDEAMTSEGARRLSEVMHGLHVGATIQYTRQPRELVEAEVLAAKDEYLRDYLLPSLVRRRQARPSDEAPLDLLELLVREQSAQPAEWTDGRVACESIHYLVAGGGTTALSVVAAMDELFAWWRANADDRQRMLEEPALLQRAVQEAIRLHPPSVYAMRTAIEEVHLASGVTIPAGSLVALDLRKANQDRSVYGEDADSFAPDRTDRIPTAGYGLAFGAGAHLCMGKRLAAGSSRSEGDSALGTATRIVRELAASGIQPDPAKRPTRDESTDREPYLTFPIVFDDSEVAGGARV